MSRLYSNVSNFNNRMVLSNLNQAFSIINSSSVFQFYHRHADLSVKYIIGLKTIDKDNHMHLEQP